MSLQDFVGKHVSTARSRGIRAAFGAAGMEMGTKILAQVDGPLRTPIWADDWDVCLVLDACRVDLMEEVVDEYDWLPDNVGRRWSVGSASPEWLSNTFDPKYQSEVKQTAYITANPFAERNPKSNSYLDRRVTPMSELNMAYLDEVFVDQWEATDTGLEIVTPEVLTGRAMHAYEHADFERLVVHYMQPHMPFKSRPEWFDGWGGRSKFGDVNAQNDRDIWIKLKDGEMGEDEFWQAYKDNLRWVLDNVEKWVYETDARILITSDHGNAKGEFGMWGHPPGVSTPQVRFVPWILVDGTGKQSIEYHVVGDPPVVGHDGGEMKAQLEALGYR